jgi:two-component system sensor histidine kinase KdpD
VGPESRWSSWPAAAAAVIGALAVSTLAVWLLEAGLEIDNASSVFLLAVSAIALYLGTWPAVATAIGAFLIYNFLFVDPRFTLTVSRAEEVLTLLLLLFVGVTISRLAGLQRAREQESIRREQEARALAGISRELVQSERVTHAMTVVTRRLVDETRMDRVWIGVGQTVTTERIAADSSPGTPVTAVQGSHYVLQRDRSEGSATWTRIHPAGGHTPSGAATPRGLYRIELRAGNEVIGSLWAQRDDAGQPHLEESRLMAAAADQLGAAVRRDRLLAQAAELEIARRSEELKSALVDSVSHNLRTPLATIRAAAGSLADPAIDLPPEERRAIAESIDTEASRLNRLVGGLLDMSRIQGGALVPDIEVIPLSELVDPAVERAAAAAAQRAIEVELPDDLPDIRADAALLDQVVSNLLDNAVKYAGDAAPIRLSARAQSDQTVALTVEDGGPGVPDSALGTIFERFSRVDRSEDRSRGGFGLGLAVVRGLVEAMGGSVEAARSELGGLAVTVTLPADAR